MKLSRVARIVASVVVETGLEVPPSFYGQEHVVRRTTQSKISAIPSADSYDFEMSEIPDSRAYTPAAQSLHCARIARSPSGTRPAPNSTRGLIPQNDTVE
jgi:hypothetical protein